MSENRKSCYKHPSTTKGFSLNIFSINNHQRRYGILLILFIISIAALPYLFPKNNVVPIDYSWPTSWTIDSMQIEVMKKEEQRQKQQQDSLKQYLKDL